MNITINEWLEDFDNAELPFEDWIEQLRDAMYEYDEKYGTFHPFQPTYNAYIDYKRRKYI